ncbi:hypothetical protein T552_01346 [Pneumocystis carinii B80]|uniref:Uncharacterized protein n=1 Tax=Pneumocystis carinii (strain B80) TaxID=1408658 RepID=A0A0W4ZLY5_PNEC8|nr:hypothetical protein T552_01346 [Pneumocystis carinii B80]KTW29393.1 hypothetical protein T552_01346 [Pneumocystis carinii B80]
MTNITGEHHQKQIKDMPQCQEIAQKNVTASSIIFRQAKKQFAALKLENNSPGKSSIKINGNAQTSMKTIGVTGIQGLPPFQNKIPVLRISPSLNTMMSSKSNNTAVIRAKVPKTVIKPGEKVRPSEASKKVITNGTIIRPSQTPKSTRIKTATVSSYQQKHSLQQTSASPNKSLIKKPNMPITLRAKTGIPYASLATSPLRPQIQKKTEIKKTNGQQETQKKQPGAIKVISVNALNARQPKVITTENNQNNKPLRLAMSLSKTGSVPKTNQCLSPNSKSPLKPFASVTNLVSHEKLRKPIFVASNTNNGSSQMKRI